MSAIYDNWERLVAAVLKKQQLWELFHAPSRSPSILSDASDSDLSSSFNDGAFGYRRKVVLFSEFSPAFDIKDLNRPPYSFIGQGTYGKVYSVIMDNGVRIAVKKLRSGIISELDFKHQMDIVGNVSHENVAPLRGYYSSENERILLYDYYSGESVHELLHGQRSDSRAQVDWGTRVRIALGAARGIAHIHTENVGRLIHGNISSSNIILNPHQFGCVSDLGLANLEGITSKLKALYYAPEVKKTNVSQASDVYSFGVLLLELLTRKSCVNVLSGPVAVDLVKLVGSSKSKRRAAKIFDADLLQDLTIRDDMVKMLQIGIQCVRKSVSKRPKMYKVVNMLEEIFKIDPRSSGSSTQNLVFIEDANHTFDLEDISWTKAKKLGEGTFGASYKAQLENGNTIVVKRLWHVTVTLNDFQQEMELFGQMRHENVSSLMAYHFSEDRKLLVYHYKQDSLSDLLHGDRYGNKKLLGWKTRLKIAVGAARGIAYIHNCSARNLVHGNIKSTNIFIDGLNNGIVSDFSLAKLGDPVGLTHWRQAQGYCAPEVKDTWDAYKASDVYSFGVVLLEIVCGRAPEYITDDNEVISLAKWVRSVVRAEGPLNVLDGELTRDLCVAQNTLLMFLRLALQCVKPSLKDRPGMPEVVKILEEISRIDYTTSKDRFKHVWAQEDPSIESRFDYTTSKDRFKHVWAQEDPSIESRFEVMLEDLLPRIAHTEHLLPRIAYTQHLWPRITYNFLV